jgi:serine/threonine protein kinase
MATDPDDELVPLGDGPVAKVLAGVHPTTGDAYALKVFPAKLDRRTRHRVRAELASLAAVRDRAPLLVADAVEELTDGRAALRMELCAQSLPELLDSFGPLSTEDTVALGGALAEALVAVHGAGLVHGGVTPGNVLFRASGEPVLSDAGPALREAFPRDRVLAAGQLAPETVRDGTVDERSDLYGLGAVMYLALAGRSPHDGPAGERPDERLLRVLDSLAPPPPRAGLPPELDELITALLAKDPAQRPRDAATVLGLLDALRSPAAAAENSPSAAENSPSGPPSGAAPEHPPLPEAEEPSGPTPDGAPILIFGPERRSPRRLTRVSLALVLAAAAVVALIVVTTALLADRPDELTVPPVPTRAEASAPAAPVPTRAVQLELAEPVDRGNYVELSWRSSEPLDFAVIVAAEGEKAKAVFVQRSTTYRVEIDPVRRYCFLIQGADGVTTYESPPKAIRGATCSV